MSLLNLIVAIRKGFSEWRLSEQAYGNLLALNDHLLADIGLHRALPEERSHDLRRASSSVCDRPDNGSDIEAAKAMLANPDIGVTQIAHRLGVSPATLYRYIPAARTANAPSV
jgi:uncharacterized protein YjiS (DUF1127 family)